MNGIACYPRIPICIPYRAPIKPLFSPWVIGQGKDVRFARRGSHLDQRKCTEVVRVHGISELPAKSNLLIKVIWELIVQQSNNGK